jgi:hypothetical protein
MPKIAWDVTHSLRVERRALKSDPPVTLSMARSFEGRGCACGCARLPVDVPAGECVAEHAPGHRAQAAELLVPLLMMSEIRPPARRVRK